MHDDGAGFFCRRRDGGNVLDLEGQRTRRFNEDDPSVGAHQPADPGADQRIVEFGLHPHPLQQIGAEQAVRAINAVAQQNMIAGRHEGQQSRRDRGQAGWHGNGFVSAFQFRDRGFESLRCRRADPAIPDAVERVAGIFQGLDRRKQHRGGVIDRRIDDAVVGAGAAAGMGEDRIWLGVFHGFC